MLLRKNFSLFVSGEKKHLNLLLGSSFTRIVIGTNDNKTNSGFTKYFKQIRKEVERDPDADKYIFIFSVKDWERNRENILQADGKIIIVDNAGLTLFADDEVLNELDAGDLIFKNQFIVKDALDDAGQLVRLKDFDWDEIQVAWLTEVKRHDYVEARLIYKERLTKLGGGKWLFTDRDTAERYGLTVLSEPRDTEYDGTDEFDVVDVTGWDTEAILQYFALKPAAHILSETALDDDIMKDCTVVLEDTDAIHNVWYIEEYGFSNLGAAKIYYQAKERAVEAKVIGPVKYHDTFLAGSIFYIWEAKKGIEGLKEGWLYVTVTVAPGLENATFEIERFEPLEDGRFSLRFVEKNGGLSDGDIVLLMGALIRQIEELKEIEGRLFWNMGVIL